MTMEKLEIKTTPEEQAVLAKMAKSHDGKILAGYLRKIVDALGNIKTMKPGESIDSRMTVVTLLEENLLARFKIMKGQVSEEDGDIDIL